MDVQEITKGNKQGHLRRISETTGVALEDMLFSTTSAETASTWPTWA